MLNDKSYTTELNDFPSAFEVFDTTINKVDSVKEHIYNTVFESEICFIKELIEQFSGTCEFSFTRSMFDSQDESMDFYELPILANMITQFLIKKGYYAKFSRETHELFVSWDKR
jgi:hypothetical protein